MTASGPSEIIWAIDCSARRRIELSGGSRGTWGHHLCSGGGCEKDWKFLCWSDSVLSCIGHAKECIMARLACAEIFDPSDIVAVHLLGKTVRSCYLMGFDENAGSKKSSSNSQPISKCDLLAFSYLSNHFHLLLKSQPDVVATWDDTQVALRWWQLCPTRKVKLGVDGQPPLEQSFVVDAAALSLRRHAG